MSRWFRHYAGMMRDEKLVRVAVKAKQPVERVVWVWGAILESAAEINDGGRYEFDTAEAAYFLHCDESELVRIVECLHDSERLSADGVARWGDRQFDSDGAKERQRRYRERVKARSDVQQRNDDVGKASRTVTRDVTPPSRDGRVTAQETESETEVSDANASSSPEPEKSAPVASLPTVSEGEFSVFETDLAEWGKAFPGVDVAQQIAAMRSWLVANPTRRKTKRGMRKFIVSWLDRRQNAAPAPRANGPPLQRNVNDVLNEIVNGNASFPSTTIDGSYARTDRGGASSFVQLDAPAARERPG